MKSAEEWPEGARHCLRVGSLADKRVIESSIEHFDVLVVQGNLAASAPQGIATWPLDKPVWIDPITYAFTASPAYLRSSGKKGGYKKTYIKLAEAFGAPFAEALHEDRAVRPDDFGDVRGPVSRVLDWQESVFAVKEGDAKYGATSLLPALLTIPFFPLSVRDPSGPSPPPWLSTNLEMINEAADLRPPHRLAAGLLADLDVFDHEYFEVWLDQYVETLMAAGVEHLWWWISDHEEVQTSLQRAVRMLNAFSKLAGRGIAVHQAFGGSLSSFALAHGLGTVAHGVNYWESKGWEPIASGGLPSARYFHPGLRERLRVPEAIAIIGHWVETASDFYERVCACGTCREVIGDDIGQFGLFGEVNIKSRGTRGGGVAEFDSPTAEALYQTKRHYLHAKGAEVALSLDPDCKAPDLLDEAARYWASDITRTRHLDRWALALRITSEEPA